MDEARPGSYNPPMDPSPFRSAVFPMLLILATVPGFSTRVSGASKGGSGPVLLTADGTTETYKRIRSVLGSDPETPDCSHPGFGPHIAREPDGELGVAVFVFRLHLSPDDDRCVAKDRQRVEIKTMGDHDTPDYLKGFRGETVAYRWRFRLPAGFQASTSFTHIHQLKAFDGDDDMPLITLTPRKGRPDALQLIHVDSVGGTTVLSDATPLAVLLGIWVEAYEKVTYGPSGKYFLELRRVSDGKLLLSYTSSQPLDLWRKGTNVVRPKWGLYRSLRHPEQLRDEELRFAGFCLAKGADDCGPGVFGSR
jgi:hypothetical protein